MALLAKLRIDSFEGRYFDRVKPSKLTVKGAWKAYRPISERDNDTWQSERGRAVHLLRQLGKKLAASLTVKEVDEYRTRRLGETTRRKSAPAPATLDKEVELLKRILNYAVACGELKANEVRNDGARLLGLGLFGSELYNRRTASHLSFLGITKVLAINIFYTSPHGGS